ncbi:hypothetical protein FB567DRAFT_92406 [Paraphoma chrysanthemicola]|uniref:Uncharacterized protein n=1 Tax=Paraphoma chrysanthemicola TaxID=798071 RepID=A0A8K0R3T0_9PLEO|nr:hypothetical protein FB567DRAFT_92406 [Paraphoma chrysanthemicola]
MAETGEYAMTHAPPDNTELALLNAFVDQRVSAELLKHKTHMFDLISANGLIARSVSELQFLSRVLSMYAETKASTGAVGVNGQLDTISLDIRIGILDGKPYVAIVSLASRDVVLRGHTRETGTEAMESFIDAVLLTGQRFKEKIERQREKYMTHIGQSEDQEGKAII